MRAPLADHLPVCLVEPGPSPVAEPFIRRFLGIFDGIGTTVEHQVAGVENLVDSAVAPLPVVRWLASCLGEDGIDPGMPAGEQRRWLEQVGELLWWRGTKKGVTGMVALLTGSDPDISDTGGVFQRGESPSDPGHVTVSVADGGSAGDEQLFALLRRELPADVTFELHVGGRLVWPANAERPR